MHQNVRGGVIMGNQSLVLQRLTRNASGTYHCVATNDEGTAFSNPVKLDIKCEYIQQLVTLAYHTSYNTLDVY